MKTWPIELVVYIDAVQIYISLVFNTCVKYLIYYNDDDDDDDDFVFRFQVILAPAIRSLTGELTLKTSAF